ncbi:DnaJ domain-containing protein [Anaerotignum sp.]
MITDPYKVLGLEEGASAEDIKKAYRHMAKVYHPDLHPNDPDITEKMNEINEAYDMLTNPAKYAVKSAQEDAQNDSGETEVVRDYGAAAAAQKLTIPRPVVQPGDSPEIEQVVAYLNKNQFQNAVAVLTQIPSTGRNARWYYLSALASQMLGNYTPAADQMQKACQMDPQNQAYMQLLMQFQRAAQIYEKKAPGFPFSPLLLVFVVLGYFLGKFFFGQG